MGVMEKGNEGNGRGKAVNKGKIMGKGKKGWHSKLETLQMVVSEPNATTSKNTACIRG